MQRSRGTFAARQLWAARLGLLSLPQWSGVELVEIVTLAGPWETG